MQEVQDKAGASYWSGLWERSSLNPPIDISSGSMHLYPQRVLHRVFQQAFTGHITKGKKLVEIGCGNSAWLPYFALHYGFDVYGIDYSQKGCEQSEAILKRENVDGTIYCADAFRPADDLIREFDVVCSFGVAEHFQDTSSTLRSFSEYLKPGGLLITTIPNMAGINGWLHKKMNRSLYDIHVPLDKHRLESAVEEAGLTSLQTAYYIGLSLNVQLTGQENRPGYAWKKIISKAGAFITLVAWWIEEKVFSPPPTKFFSRGIFSVARKAG